MTSEQYRIVTAFSGMIVVLIFTATLIMILALVPSPMGAAVEAQSQGGISPECIRIRQYLNDEEFEALYKQYRRMGKVTWAFCPTGGIGRANAYTVVLEKDNCK